MVATTIKPLLLKNDDCLFLVVHAMTIMVQPSNHDLALDDNDHCDPHHVVHAPCHATKVFKVHYS